MSRNVLVVDDAAFSRALIHRGFLLAGYSVREAATGEAARLLIAEQAPDLIVLHLGGPDTHGIEVCRQLKADPVSATIPVILVADGAPGTVGQWLGESGADACIPGSWTVPQVVTVAQGLLSHMQKPAGRGP